MARFGRVVIRGMPHHVTQRGNRRRQTFVNDGDHAEHDVSGAIGQSRRSRAKTPETRPKTEISGSSAEFVGGFTSDMHQGSTGASSLVPSFKANRSK